MFRGESIHEDIYEYSLLKMKSVIRTTELILLWSVCAMLSMCRPQCRLVESPAQLTDTLDVDDEIYALSLPEREHWELDPDGVASIIVKNTISGIDLVAFYITDRIEPGNGPYENNEHDYRGDSYFHTDPLTGERSDVRFVRHICSSIGGWYGVFECDPFLQGDTVFVQCFVAKQEAPDRIMAMEVWGRFNTTDEQKALRKEVYQFIASTEWLSATQPRWQR